MADRLAGPTTDDPTVVVGELVGVYGVRGWLRLKSFTQPPENILDYEPWLARNGAAGEWRKVDVLEARPHGKGLVVHIAGVDDRDQAATLVGTEVAVPRSQLPQPEDGEFYWSDLIGLDVVTTDGALLGQVDNLMETGANDVLIVRGDRERLVPFLLERVVKSVDLDAGRIEVDWDPDF